MLRISILLFIALVQTSTAFVKFQYRLKETDKTPKEVGNLQQDLPDKEFYKIIKNWKQVEYEILGTGDPVNYQLFYIDTQNGQLKTKSIIDREEICKSSGAIKCSQAIDKDNCKRTLMIKVKDKTDESKYLIAEITIVIDNIDNKIPRFEPIRSSLQISESAAVGSTLQLPIAEDLDSNGQASCSLNYQLIPCSNKYSLDKTFALEEVVSDDDSPKTIKLKLQRELDHEKVSSFTYCVTAHDSGEQQTATTTVHVEVIDVNDNTPIWSPIQVFTVNVSENHPPKVLLRLNATDDDKKYGNIQYSFLRDNGRTFILNEYTGEITLRSQQSGLDYETNKVHYLTVVAKDNGVPPKSITGTVTINVLDENDCKPEILIRDNHINVIENNKKNMYLQFIQVSDRDPGQNGNVSCQLYPAELRDSFVLENKLSGVAGKVYLNLYANVIFDRETKDRYDLLLTCFDQGTPRLSDRRPITIAIQDEDDNAPRFPVNPINFAVKENNRRGEKLYELQVEDKDHPYSRKFIISNEGSGFFNVDMREKRLAYITAAQSFDREDRDFYSFTVTVMDYDVNKNKLHNATVNVSVSILDVNDNSPIFDKSTNHTSFSVYENTTVGTVLGYVKATDKDLGDFGKVIYRMETTYPNNQYFALDSFSGKIKLKKPLERDGPGGKTQFRLKIVASDTGLPHHEQNSATVEVLIFVQDCNDNRPQFVHNQHTTINVLCDDSTENHQIYVDTTVEDLDPTEAFRLKEYKLTAVPDYEDNPKLVLHAFSCDKDTGQIFLRKAPEKCTYAKYRLTLEVFEPHYPTQTNRKQITVLFEGGDRKPGRRTDVTYLKHPNQEPNKSKTDTEGIIIAALIIASVVLAVVLIATVLLLRKRLQRDRGYSKGRVIVQSRQQSSAPPSCPLPRKDMGDSGLGDPSMGTCSMDSVCAGQTATLNSLHINRYGSLFKQNRKRNTSLDEDQPSQLPNLISGSYSQQLSPDGKHTYQTILPQNMSASEGYMTCQYPSSSDRSGTPGLTLKSSKSCSRMIDSKRPSEPNALKSSYFTVSFV